MTEVSKVSGITYFSGAGEGWTVLDHSRKYANAGAYDLDDPASVFCGTSAEPLGAKAGKQNSAFAFDGPNSQSMPYTLSVDMRKPETFTHWRVASNPHYGFDDAHLESWDSSKGQFVRVQGSEVHYWNSRCEDGFAYASFTSAVTSSKWRICITSYGNTSNYQAMFQCYLTEAQFGRSLEAERITFLHNLLNRCGLWIQALAVEKAEVEEAAAQNAAAEGMECSFWFVHADSLRRAWTPSLPMMQTLRTQEPHRLVQKTIGFVEGISGAYKNILVVSHRWETPTDPDPTGAQALAVQAYLKAHPEIDAVWFDFSSMPQGAKKTQRESAEFKEMLPNINLLYLTCSVLILMDRTYMSRFWTQFEAYLSMRAITSDGLTNALDPKARVTIKMADEP